VTEFLDTSATEPCYINKGQNDFRMHTNDQIMVVGIPTGAMNTVLALTMDGEDMDCDLLLRDEDNDNCVIGWDEDCADSDYNTMEINFADDYSSISIPGTTNVYMTLSLHVTPMKPLAPSSTNGTASHLAEKLHQSAKIAKTTGHAKNTDLLLLAMVLEMSSVLLIPVARALEKLQALTTSAEHWTTKQIVKLKEETHYPMVSATGSLEAAAEALLLHLLENASAIQRAEITHADQRWKNVKLLIKLP
jgi:hypothetical protein